MDHTDLQTAADRLSREFEILSAMADDGDVTTHVHVSLLLQQTKRVRTASNVLVRALARTRDQLQP